MHGILSGDTRTVYVIQAVWSPYITTSLDGNVLDRFRYWAGASEWSQSIGAAVLFQSHEAAEAQVRHMNLREWSITAIGEPLKE